MNNYKPLIELAGFMAIMPKGVVIFNNKCMIRASTKTFSRIIGYSYTELEDMNIEEIVPPDVCKQFLNDIKILTYTSQELKTAPPILNVPLTCKDGNIISTNIERYSYKYNNRRRFAAVFEFLGCNYAK